MESQFLCVKLQESILQERATYKKLSVFLFTFNTSFFSPPSNHGSSLRNSAAPNLAVNFNGVGTALDLQPVTGVPAQNVGLAFG